MRASNGGRAGNGTTDVATQLYHTLSSSHSAKRTGDAHNGSRPMNPHRPPDPLASAYLARLAEPPTPATSKPSASWGTPAPSPERNARPASC